MQYDTVHYEVASRGLEPRHHGLHPCALPVELRSQTLREQESNLRCRGPKPRRPCQQTIPECVRAGGFEPPTGSVSENCSHQTELHARELHQRGPGRSRTDYLSRARGARYQVRHKPKTPAGGDRGYCLLRASGGARTRSPSLEDWCAAGNTSLAGCCATPTGIEPATLRSTGGCSTTELRSQERGACPRQESNLHSSA